jgi:hypothetical protein
VVAGGLLFFSLLAGFSIGLLTLPIAAAACVLLVIRGHFWPEVLGGIAGVGLTCLGIALANRGSSACPSSGFGVSAEDAGSQPPGSVLECGGLDPGPWLLAGCVLVGTGIAGYALAAGSRRHRGAGLPG